MSDEHEYFNLIFFAVFVKVAYIVSLFFFSEARVAPPHPQVDRASTTLLYAYIHIIIMCISKNRGRAFDLRSPPQQRRMYIYKYISSSRGVAAVEISSRGFLPYTLLFILQAIFYAFYTHVLYMYAEVRGGCFFSSFVTSSLRAYDKSAPPPRSRFMYLYPPHILRDARAEATVGITAAAADGISHCAPLLLHRLPIFCPTISILYRLSSSALLAHNNYYF